MTPNRIAVNLCMMGTGNGAMYVRLMTLWCHFLIWVSRFADRWVLIRTDDDKGVRFHTLRGKEVAWLSNTKTKDPLHRHLYAPLVYYYPLPSLSEKIEYDWFHDHSRAEEFFNRALKKRWWGAVILSKDWDRPWPKS